MSSKQQEAAAAMAARLAANAKRQAPKSKPKGNTGVVAFAVVVGAAFFSLPFLTHFTKVRLVACTRAHMLANLRSHACAAVVCGRRKRTLRARRRR